MLPVDFHQNFNQRMVERQINRANQSNSFILQPEPCRSCAQLCDDLFLGHGDRDAAVDGDFFCFTKVNLADVELELNRMASSEHSPKMLVALGSSPMPGR